MIRMAVRIPILMFIPILIKSFIENQEERAAKSLEAILARNVIVLPSGVSLEWKGIPVLTN